VRKGDVLYAVETPDAASGAEATRAVEQLAAGVLDEPGHAHFLRRKSRLSDSSA
jgi:hypothetical protein